MCTGCASKRSISTLPSSYHYNTAQRKDYDPIPHPGVGSCEKPRSHQWGPDLLGQGLSFMALNA